MSTHLTDALVATSKLIALGDAIRAKVGLSNEMTLDEMATTIANIPSGGSSISVTSYGVVYNLSGSTITVPSDYEPTPSAACRCGYLSGSVYTYIASTENQDGSHSFTVPSGITDVVLVVKGNSTLSGSLSSSDIDLTDQIVKGGGGGSLSDIPRFAADTNHDGRVTNADKTQAKSALNGYTTLNWD